jgi:hypothetical protein
VKGAKKKAPAKHYCPDWSPGGETLPMTFSRPPCAAKANLSSHDTGGVHHLISLERTDVRSFKLGGEALIDKTPHHQRLSTLALLPARVHLPD